MKNKNMNYIFIILILITGMSIQQYRINQLQYWSVDNAVECIGKVGKMTREDVDYCRPLLLKLGFKERKSDEEG
tara:strand:+ start:533 stop:754 length:222 start_codon:yes stop_codon:yes gene_type:complete